MIALQDRILSGHWTSCYHENQIEPLPINVKLD